MDSDAEMMMELLIEDEAAAADQKQRMTVLLCFREQLVAVSH
jgi:hypothetical protein